MENMGRNDSKCRGGFCLINIECGPLLPIIMIGTAANPMSTTRYWLSEGSVPICQTQKCLLTKNYVKTLLSTY